MNRSLRGGSASKKTRKSLERSSEPEIISAGSLVAENASDSSLRFRVVCLFAVWAAFCLVTLTFDNFRWMLPKLAAFAPYQQSYRVSFYLFLGMVAAVRFLPAGLTQDDFTPKISRLLLLASLGLGAFLCFYRLETPMGNYSIDTAYNIAHIRHIVDLANYQGSLTPTYAIWPLWQATAILLWYLFPDTSSIPLQRLANGVLDLGAIWLLYLAGKRIGGRRMGLFAAALAAVSKPLLVKIIAGVGYSAMTFGMSLALLFTLRLMDKKGVWDFVKWGLSVGFLAYTCTPFQPLIPFFVYSVFALIFFQKEKSKFNLPVLATFGVLLYYFLYCNNAFPGKPWMDSLLTQSWSSFQLWVLAALLTSGFGYVFWSYHQKTGNHWVGWMVGSWVSAILSFPVLANPELLSRIRSHSLVAGSGFLNWSYLSASLTRVFGTFQALFWIGGDRSDLAPAADAYFSYPEVIFIVLGLAFALGRPNLKIGFLVAAALVAIAPHFVSTEAHSGRLMACPPPFLLIGAYGLNELVKGFLLSKTRKSFPLLLSLLLLGFWVWSAAGVFSRVYSHWALKPVGLMALRNQAIQDVADGIRVYLPPSLSDGDLSILYEGHSVHLLLTTNNLIAVEPGEKIPEVEIFVGAGSPEKQALEKTFPRAKWSEIHNSDQDPARSAVSLRCQIPPEDLSNPGQKLFHVQRVAPPYWKRTYTRTNGGLGFGFLSWDDKTSNVNDPVSPEVYIDYAGVRYEGVIHVAKSGEYVFHCKTINRTEVLVDQKKIFNLYFFRTGYYMAGGSDVNKTLNLMAGDHRLEVTTCFQRTFGPPEITLFLKENGGPGRSLWSTFDF